MLAQLLVNGLVNGCVLALMAVGFALIYNTTRIFHVAHGAVFVVGAYAYYLTSQRLLWPEPFAVGAALVASALCGLAIEALAYAPLYRKQAPSTVCLLTSFGLYIAIINMVALVFGNEVQVLRPTEGAAFEVGPILVSRVQLLEVAVSVLALTPVMIMLRRSDWGRLIRAVRDNPQLVTTMGVNLLSIRRLVFVIGSMLASAAAVLSVVDVGISPQAGMPVLLMAAVAAIVGGIGTFGGALIGSFVVAVLQSVSVWRVSSKWSDAITFGMLILFMIFCPTGLLGRRGRVEEAPD